MIRLIRKPSFQKLSGWLLHHVGRKLAAIVFGSIVLLVGMLGALSYRTSAQILTDYAARSSQMTVMQAAQKLDLQLQLFAGLSVQIASDVQLKSTMYELQKGGSRANVVHKINARLDSYRLTSTFIKSVYLVPVQNTTGPPELVSADSQLHPADLEREAAWFAQTVSAAGEVVWFDTQRGGYLSDTAQPVFVLGRYLPAFDGVDGDYALFFEIGMEALTSQLTGMAIGEHSRTWIVNEQNAIVQAENAETIGQPSDTPVDQADGTFFRAGQAGEELVLAHPLSLVKWTVVEAAPVAELTRDTRRIVAYTVGMVVVSACIAAVIGYLIIRFIVRPLERMRTAMSIVEQGDLSVRVGVKGRDEIGQLGHSINRMLEQISGLIARTRDSTSEVLSASGLLLEVSRETAGTAKDITLATEDISRGALSLADEVERGNEIGGLLGERLRQLLDGSTALGASAANIREISRQGGENMAGLTSNTQAMEAIMSSMMTRVEQLKGSTSSIQKVLALLVQLAKQTTILSLNASIEAARAGTAGRGFAVVADEIRGLAEQSRHSIQLAETLIASIEQEVGGTVAVVSEAFPIFQRQMGSVEESGVIFEQVQTTMAHFQSGMTEMSGILLQLDTAHHTLEASLQSVSAFAQQSSAGCEQVAALSKEQFHISSRLVDQSVLLEELAASLRQAMQQFNT